MGEHRYLLHSHYLQFQEISIPPLWKINGNSKGEGGGKSKQYGAKFEFLERGGGANQKTFLGSGIFS